MDDHDQESDHIGATTFQAGPRWKNEDHFDAYKERQVQHAISSNRSYFLYVYTCMMPLNA